MSNKSREVIFGSRIRGAKIRAEGAREEAVRAVRAADRAEAEAWSIRMEGYGVPARPSPTITQCLNGGYRNVCSMLRFILAGGLAAVVATSFISSGPTKVFVVMKTPAGTMFGMPDEGRLFRR